MNSYTQEAYYSDIIMFATLYTNPKRDKGQDNRCFNYDQAVWGR